MENQPTLRIPVQAPCPCARWPQSDAEMNALESWRMANTEQFLTSAAAYVRDLLRVAGFDETLVPGIVDAIKNDLLQPLVAEQVSCACHPYDPERLRAFFNRAFDRPPRFTPEQP